MPDRKPLPTGPVRSPAVGSKGRLTGGARIRLCLSSVPSRDAARISRLLVTRRVAACVSVLPGVLSVFYWKGKLERAPEVLLLVKTTAASVARCVALLAEAHPYDVPEILVVTPVKVSSAYAAWLHAETF